MKSVWKFGSILRKMRKSAGLSQEAMAEEMLIARSSISKLENNLLELKAADLIRWCNITNAPEIMIAMLIGADGIGQIQQIIELITSSGILGFISKLFM